MGQPKHALFPVTMVSFMCSPLIVWACSKVEVEKFLVGSIPNELMGMMRAVVPYSLRRLRAGDAMTFFMETRTASLKPSLSW